MLRQKALLPFICLLAFAAALPPGAPWTNFIPKPVYSRALGPMGPMGMDTISVPYMAKPSMFPKFVDPKTMISKKTDMLSNLFGGLGPVAYNPADGKPITVPYGASGSPYDNVGVADNTLFSTKRDTLQVGKEKTFDGSSGTMSKRGMFGPFTPKFGPMAPKFGPITPFSSADMMADYAPAGKDFFSRRRRSVVGAPADSAPTLGLAAPSSFLKGTDSAEGAADATAVAGDAPKESLPGMFGPFGGPFGGPFAGPFGGPVGPMVDPSMMMTKKTTFLDTLFKSLATSTAAPPTATDVPAPKSTIVPPSYWMPSSIIPDPSEYTSKVSDFLDKLFDSIKLNTTAKVADDSSDSSEAKSAFMMRSLKPDDAAAERTARASQDLSAIETAKDSVVDAILSELGNLKSDMMGTLSDLIAYEKASAAASAAAAKKPFKPFAGIFPSKPTVDPTLPFQQRMTVLSQVFDTLIDLQRNITAATNNAMTTNANAADNSEESTPKSPSAVGASSFNATLLDAVLKKLSAVVTPAPYAASDMKVGSVITSRALSKGPMSFWVSYPENGATAKRQVDDYSYFDRNDDDDRRRQFTRGVKMQMHQGYQSLPAGSVESVQAGGGSTPGHQGGGIKLLIQMPKSPDSQSINYT
ncbi:uncharacterized protein LOC116841683 isoform X2 [Odontomachus brunneus]|uniref:uncharacterized protein LOC116841683 isoform X2 n=1 Tax=Odontomachus brunneus TaxID=486640 RepID=UPI0013F29993|nr:uncharacterized protein LOC116841683 isoform X2 [Odontomachus brunneus]